MGKTKELLPQQAMKAANRFRLSRENLLKERMSLGEDEFNSLLDSWKNEKKERKKADREKLAEERKRQLELFPEQRESSLWKKSIEQLSASKLSTYRGCPIAYYFNYIMHFKVPQSPSKIFGKEVHHMIEMFHKVNFKSSESFIKFWMHRWWGVVKGEYGDTDIKFRDKEQPGILCGLGVNILRPFYEHNKNLPKPELFEEDFSKYNISFNGIKLTGKWDRVDRIGGKVIITDYKTDFFSPAQNTFLLHRHPQFTFYALAWNLKYNEIPHLALHHLRTGQVFKTRRTEDDFEYLKDVISKTKERVLEGDYTPFYGFHCKNCDFMNSACRQHCVGVGSKLKSLEQELKAEPEIDEIFSYDVPRSNRIISGNDAHKKYADKNDFKNAYYSLIKYLQDVQCPIEAREGIMSCMLWDEDSPMQLPEHAG